MFKMLIMLATMLLLNQSAFAGSVTLRLILVVPEREYRQDFTEEQRIEEGYCAEQYDEEGNRTLICE